MAEYVVHAETGAQGGARRGRRYWPYGKLEASPKGRLTGLY